ncbi:Zn-dependent hydrolase (beta-lactmase superfamily) [Giardia duodenalis]|uniref:Zn-dependent hydrolase (Beta-lactmase superfamily) n=1 Tax=Giardia intestinalis TaxID=5741 RepID=V6TNR8_GIAIN|nr:Zn-dependent hydrolase (beta-lactmase superfamily) [Giardia intestinalis]
MAARGEQQAKGKADTRAMLLRPASNHRILLCSPALLHHAAPTWPCSSFQRHSQPTGGVACPCEVTATRGGGDSTSDQRGTQEGTHTDTEGASQKLETGPSPM